MSVETDTTAFDEKYIPEPMGGCWLWTASLGRHGYGQVWANGTMALAHRIAYELFKGPIPENLCVLHRCDVKSCVNPDHLWLGTKAENMADRDKKGRHGGSKLTEAQVLEIRAATGTHRQIASRFAIGPRQVGNIKKRQRWAHLQGV